MTRQMAAISSMRFVDGDAAGFGVISSVARNATQDRTLDDTPLWAFGHIRERQLLDRATGGNGSLFAAGRLLSGSPWCPLRDGLRPRTHRRPSAADVGGPAFVFLGPAYGPTLRELYTSFGSDDLVRRRGLFEREPHVGGCYFFSTTRAALRPAAPLMPPPPCTPPPQRYRPSTGVR